jgi:hypothetical protein
MIAYYLVSGIVLLSLGIIWNPRTVLDTLGKITCIGVGIVGIVYYIISFK